MAMDPKLSGETGPEAGLDDGDPAAKRQLLLCAEFSTVASCDAAVAQRYLAENAWEMEVGSPGPVGAGPRAHAHEPPPCLFSFRGR